MTGASLQIRTSAQDKEEAGKVLDSLGITYSQLVNALLKEIIRTKSVPFAIDLRRNADASAKELSEEDLRLVAGGGSGISAEEAYFAFRQKKMREGLTDELTILAAFRREKPEQYRSFLSSADI